MLGENFKRLNRKNSTIEKLRNEIETTKSKLQNNLKENDYTWNNSHIKLEKQIETLEHELYYTEYEDNRRRNWK